MKSKIFKMFALLIFITSSVYGACPGTTLQEQYLCKRFFVYDNDETGIWVYLDFKEITTLYADNKGIIPNKGHEPGVKKFYVSYPNGLEIPLTGSPVLNAYFDYMNFIKANPQFLAK